MKEKVRTRKMLVNGTKEDVVIEDDYRRKLIGTARELGCEPELRQLFAKYDALLRNCSNPKEAQAIGALGVADVSRLLDNNYVGLGGNITVNGQIIIDDSKDKKDAGK